MSPVGLPRIELGVRVLACLFSENHRAPWARIAAIASRARHAAALAGRRTGHPVASPSPPGVAGASPNRVARPTAWRVTNGK